MSGVLEARHLRLVRAISAEGSLTRASTSLNLTQSALSHQLADLEARLGVRLFDRVGRRLRLTSSGQKLVEASVILLRGLEEVENEIRHGDVGRRVLRIATQCFSCFHWLPSLVPTFEQLHPGIRVQLVVESTRKALDALRDDVVDVAITTEEGHDPRWVHMPAFDDELVLAVRPEHRLAARKRVRWRDLEGEIMLTHPTAADDVAWFRRAVVIEHGTGRPQEIQQVPLTEAIVELASSGYGVALLTMLAAEQPVADGRLIALPFAPKRLVRRFHAVSLRRNPRRLPIDDFVRSIAEFFGTGRGRYGKVRASG